MFDTNEALLDAIRLGESSFLEFKDVHFEGRKLKGPRPDRLADGLAAFANSRGGVFVLGVEDGSRTVVGIAEDRLDQVTQMVRSACTDRVDPPIESMTLSPTKLPDVDGRDVAVIRIDVPASLFVHRSPGGFIHRVGDSKRTMSTEYLARLFQQRSQSRLIRFDEQIVASATIDDLASPLWRRLRTERTGNDRDELLVKLHMARQDADGRLRPTVAGIAMATRDPRQWIPNAYVQAVAYRGTRIAAPGSADPYQLDAADITGPLDEQVEQACRFVAKNMRVAAFKDLGRRDRPDYDMTAIFEALVNAVAHRDYSIHGAKIRLGQFSDRVELYSPGCIPNSMAVGSLPHMQSARNESITSILAKCPVPERIPRLMTDRRTMMDRRGEGVPLILDNTRRLSGREPVYQEIDDALLLLTIPSANAELARELDS